MFDSDEMYDDNNELNFDLDGDGTDDVYAEEFDLDGDGVVDTWGIDSDGDGIVDVAMTDSNYDGAVDIWSVDTDGDGIVDYTEADTDYDGYAESIDSNGDGLIDIYTSFADIDGDGIEDQAITEADTNYDGLTDTVVVETDLNGDGYADAIEYINDYNQDGIIDDVEMYADSDGDGIVDTVYHEYDSDGDGAANAFYAATDLDGDGVADYVEQGEAIDTDGDGIVDTYVHSVDSDGDGIFDIVNTYDYAEGVGILELGAVEPLTVVPYSEPSYEEYDQFENYDPATADNDAISGDPASSVDEWEFQGDTNRCALYAQKFVIDEFTDQDIDMEEFADIAEENGWFDEENGTSILNMAKMLDYFGIDNEMSFNNDIDDIKEVLENGGKVIVSLDADEIWYGDDDTNFSPNESSNHAVEVIGIDNSDPDNPMVIINDSGHPDGQGAMIPLDEFVDAWEDGDCQMIECMM